MNPYWRKTIITDIDKNKPKISESVPVANPMVAGQLSRDKRAILLDTLAVNHSHSEMTQWAMCKACQDKFQQYKLKKSKLTDIEREQLNKEVLQKVKEINPVFLEKFLAQKRAEGELPEIE